MKFLVDAQLPAKVARALQSAGHDAVHTSQLPDGNRSTDRQITLMADAEDRVVITKDSDFRVSHLVQGSPRRLLLVTTGNVPNDALLALLQRHLDGVVAALDEARFVELGPATVTIHDNR